jgi:C-terminal binding protein
MIGEYFFFDDDSTADFDQGVLLGYNNYRLMKGCAVKTEPLFASSNPAALCLSFASCLFAQAGRRLVLCWIDTEQRTGMADATEQRPLYICLDATDGGVERDVLAETARVRMLGAKSAAELKDEDLSEALVVAVWHTIRVDEVLLQRLVRCVAIVRMGVGYDNVDIAAAGKLGIPVCNIPDYGTEEVADSALALVLGLFRGSLAGVQLLSAGAQIRGADAIAAAVPYVRRVRGSTLGLIGLGRIGSAVAVRAKACGFDVIFFDPYREDGADKALGIGRADSLAELLRVSHCVSLHCNCVSSGVDPAATRAAPMKMIDAAALAQMRRGALLVNTARGELIDEAALAEALRSGHVAAAALDVHWNEPYQRDAGPLACAPNLYCCAHQAWYSPESRAEMRRKGAETALRALEIVMRDGGGTTTLRNVVNAAHLLNSRLAQPAQM